MTTFNLTSSYFFLTEIIKVVDWYWTSGDECCASIRYRAVWSNRTYPGRFWAISCGS